MLYLGGAQTGSKELIPGKIEETKLDPLVTFIYTVRVRSGFASCLPKDTRNMDVNPTEGVASAEVDSFSQQEVEEFSIDALLKNLEVFQRRQQLETLERIIINSIDCKFLVMKVEDRVDDLN